MKRLVIAGVMFEIALLIIGLTWIAPFAHRSSEVKASPVQARPTVSSAHTSTAAATGAEGGKVAVALDQWSVTPTATELPAGKVTFTVSNVGTITHEFVVLRTSTPAADIPIASFEGEKNRINEDTAGTNVGETGDMEAGRTKTLTLNLRPGHYVFLCNLPAHYALGMHTDVTVSSA